MEIAVTDTDPQRAQAVARELANQVILQGPAGRAGGERQAFVEQRLQKLEADISATEAEMERKQIEMANELSASKIRRLETDLSTLASKVNALQTSYSELYSTSLGGAANTIYIFEPAGLPTGTLSKGYLVYALAAMVFGLVLAGAGAYVLEYQDDSIKSATQIREVLGLPTLGAIPTLVDGPKSGGNPVIMMENSLQANGRGVPCIAHQSTIRIG